MDAEDKDTLLHPPADVVIDADLDTVSDKPKKGKKGKKGKKDK